MRKEGQRIISAWLLLSVFASMILLSGLHRHEVMANIAIDCADCTHHIHHSGHFIADASHMDDCVLCQFLSLVYTPAAISQAAIPFCITIQAIPGDFSFVCQETDLYKTTRAPPFIL